MDHSTTSTWTCAGCGERIEYPFAICFRCGTDRTGKPDPTFEREIDAADAAAQTAAIRDRAGRRNRRALQFTLRGLMVSTTVLCVLSAIAWYCGPALLWAIVFLVFVANLFGLLAGFIVTHLFGLPNDGSNPAEREKTA
jgi:hypothetical protein